MKRPMSDNKLACDVAEFHEAVGQQIGDLANPSLPRPLRRDLMREELREYEEAVDAGSIIGTVDALIDLLYVTVGTLVEMGVELGPAFAEVHRSNMSKLDADGKPVLRADGKILKGPNYSPPDLAKVLAAQVAKHGGIR